VCVSCGRMLWVIIIIGVFVLSVRSSVRWVGIMVGIMCMIMMRLMFCRW